MRLNNTETTINSSNLTFYCTFAPNLLWEVSGSASHLIIGLITIIASPPTILLNASIILAIIKRKELQKPSNIFLSSLAVTDLLIGIIVMPTSATTDFFILRQVELEYICMLRGVNLFFLPLLFGATLLHLTIIAWERYVAVHRWMHYKAIIKNERLKKIVIAAWLSALFPSAANFIVTVVRVDHRIVNASYIVWTIVNTACLLVIAFFYLKVYQGIRNRKLNEISQIHVLMKAKLEFKVAKTTGLLTTVIIFSFFPAVFVMILRNVVPIFRTSDTLRCTLRVTQLISLLNPLLYCYRDHRFRNAICDLLGRKKPQAVQAAVGAAEFVRRNDPATSLELQKVGERAQRLKRSASCNPTYALDSDHGKPTQWLSGRLKSA